MTLIDINHTYWALKSRRLSKLIKKNMQICEFLIFNVYINYDNEFNYVMTDFIEENDNINTSDKYIN